MREYSRNEYRTEETRAEEKRAGISKFTVFAYLTCFALLLMMIFSYVQLNEISDQSVKLERELNELREQNQMLGIRIDQRMGGDQIKQQAIERLGMVTLSKDQVTYVNTKNTDTVEIISQSQILRDHSKIFAGLARGFRWLVEYMN